MPSSSDSSPVSPRLPLLTAGVMDAAVILVFAAIGRDAHQRGETITGVLATAWPFLAGAAAAWLLARVWRRPLSIWPAGVSVWTGALVGGMILRAVTGQTVVLPFIIVATLSLGILLLGYRAVALVLTRLRSRRPAP